MKLWRRKFPIESKHSGEVKNLTPYGVFVELEEGIGGMVHISDLSWTKRFSHPSEFTKVGETIDICILEIDKENRKLSLGHKQLEENPWDTFQNVFPAGTSKYSTNREHNTVLIRCPVANAAALTRIPRPTEVVIESRTIIVQRPNRASAPRLA